MPNPTNNVHQALRKVALRQPDAEEGVACVGTALEKSTIRANKKAFVFLGAKDVMLKLGASLAAASKLAKDHPNVRVGKNGWVTIPLEDACAIPWTTLETWVEESYALVVSPPAAVARDKLVPKKKKSTARKPTA